MCRYRPTPWVGINLEYILGAANTCNNRGSILRLFVFNNHLVYTVSVLAFANDIKAQIEYILTLWQRLRWHLK